MTEDPIEPKQLSWQDYRAILIRRRWWLIGPFFLFGLAGFAVAMWWPARYRSEALIRVEEQRVPTQYVTPNVVTDVQERLQEMTQEILSRTRLQRLVEQLDLYRRERRRISMDEILNKMRQDIMIEVAKTPAGNPDPNAFHISYLAANPYIAQQVTNQLASLFIEENLRKRAQLSVGTTQFLENELVQAQKDLNQQEERLRLYKTSFLGELPQQEQSNLQILQSLEAQLHASSEALGRAEQQKIYLESLRAEHIANRQSLDSKTQTSSSGVAAMAVWDLRKRLSELEAKYTPAHPDVVKLKRELVRWEALKQDLETRPVSSGEGATRPEKAEYADQPALIEVDSRLKAVKAEIENEKGQVEKLQRRIEGTQSHLSLTPVREQQLAQVTRNYENSHRYYQSLLQKKLDSELATNLEKHQQGEQFRIIDPASLPLKPDQPRRKTIILLSWLGGLFAGIGLVALREMVDETLRNEHEVLEHLGLPILVHVPVLRSPSENARDVRNQALEVAGVMLLTLVSMAVGLYTYRVS